MRVATLSFLIAVAFTEIAFAVLFGEAWRAGRGSGRLSGIEIDRLDRAVDAVQSLQLLTVVATVLGAFIWSVLVGWYAARAGKSARTALGVAASWVVAAGLLVALTRVPEPDGFEEMWMVMLPLKALVIFVPFLVLGESTTRAGGARVGFFSTYLAIAASFVLHEVVVVRTDIGVTASADMMRSALLAFVSSVVLGVATLLAADATRSVHKRTVEGARHRFRLDPREAQRFQTPATVAKASESGLRV